jgi:cobalt-zinc-cadmium efflux system membrane fusion protein
MKYFRITIFAAAAVSAMTAGSCGESTSDAGGEAAEASSEAEAYERGPHRGRMLRDGSFAVEITIFEDGVEPEFHVYAYENDKPVPPQEVQLTVELHRLGDRVDRFAFSPREDYLLGNGVVAEPHSFEVKVSATRAGKASEWAYDSFEGRTTISQEQADAAGVKVEAAGPALIDEVVTLTGRVELQPEGRAEVRAWYPGRIITMTRTIGEQVEQGQTLATVTSSESLQTYAIPAPISGIIMERGANVGDVAGGSPLYVIADPRKLHAEFFIYPRDAERLRAGQPVTVSSIGGAHSFAAKIEVVLPTSDMLTQTVIAHVELPNPDGLSWRPGQAVEGQVVIAADEAPLAVRTRALQRFRDFTVVYARVGETYEVRMLELGRQSPEWTEVLRGIEPGEIYVSDNAFLIRADVEKTGAGHDH